MRHKVLFYTTNLKLLENIESLDDCGFDYKVAFELASLFDYDAHEHCMIVVHEDSCVDGFIETFRDLKKEFQELKLMLICNKPDVLKGVAYLKEGIKAYGNSFMHPVHMLQAIDVVCEGNVWIYPELATYMIQQTPTSTSTIDALSEMDAREKEIITFVCKGMRNKDIADMLCLSEISVKKLLTQIYQKLNVSDRIEMIAFFNRSS